MILVKEKKISVGCWTNKCIRVWVRVCLCAVWIVLSFSSCAQNPVYLNEKVLFLNKLQIIFRILYILLCMPYINTIFCSIFFLHSFSFQNSNSGCFSFVKRVSFCLFHAPISLRSVCFWANITFLLYKKLLRYWNISQFCYFENKKPCSTMQSAGTNRKSLGIYVLVKCCKQNLCFRRNSCKSKRMRGI